MIEDFNTYLKTIDSNFWTRLCLDHGTLQLYNKGDEYITIGKVAPHIGLIKSGSVKYLAYDSEREEKVVGLETVGGFAASWPFCLNDLPSVVTIQANTNLEIYSLPTSKILELAEQDREMEKQIAHSTEQVFYTAYERLISLYTLSPKERYEQMLARSPRIFDIFTLKDIASYLNITPQHLSRLRGIRSSKI